MNWLPKRCVVVPFDFSDLAVTALNCARAFVAEPAQLHVVHVLSEILMEEPGMIWDSVDNDARGRHATIAFRERFAGSPAADLDFQVRFGDPGQEISAFAEQLEADLIVMGSHGRTGVTRFLVGSVAERVVRLAHCPVLILKSSEASPA